MNLFQSSVVFEKETSHLILYEMQHWAELG